MKDKWACADLRKPKIQTIFDTLVLLLLVISYVPQLKIIFIRRSTSGITQSYVMFTYLFTATQLTLVMLYSSYGRPIVDCIKDQRIRGLDAYGAVVGAVQMCVLWFGSLLLLICFSVFSNRIDINRSTPSSSVSTGHPDNYQRRRHTKTILFICIIHACIWLLPAMGLSLRRPITEPTFHPARIFVGYCDYLLVPTCIVLVTSVFPLQISELLSMKERIHETDLSPTTLWLQLVTLILIAYSWRLNLGQPGDPFNITPPGTTQPWVLYRLGAWLWVNNVIFGFGQGLLLLVYWWVKTRHHVSERSQVVDETTALL